MKISAIITLFIEEKIILKFLKKTEVYEQKIIYPYTSL